MKSWIRKIFSLETLFSIPIIRSLLAILLIRYLLLKCTSPKYQESDKNVLGLVIFLLFILLLFVGSKKAQKSNSLQKLSSALGDLIEMYWEIRSTRSASKANIWVIKQGINSIPHVIIQSVFNLMNRLSNKNYTDRAIDWYGQMVHVSRNLLNEEERKSLEEWDKTMVDGSGNYATSDWPGWEKYIGLPPWKQKR